MHHHEHFSIICYRTNRNKSRQWWRRLGRRRAFLKACCNMPNADIRATWATTLMMITITGLPNGRCEPWSQVFLDTGCEFLYVCWLFTRSLWWWTLASPGWFIIGYHRVLVIQFELESSRSLFSHLSDLVYYTSTKLTLTISYTVNCETLLRFSIKALLKEMEAEEAMVNTPAVPWKSGVCWEQRIRRRLSTFVRVERNAWGKQMAMNDTSRMNRVATFL